MPIGANAVPPSRDGAYPGEVVGVWVWLGPAGGWSSADQVQTERLVPERDTE